MIYINGKGLGLGKVLDYIGVDYKIVKILNKEMEESK